MNQKIRTFIKIAVYPFLYLFLGLSYVMPRNKNIWLFGTPSHTPFSDNVKYLFIYVSENHPQIRAIWLSVNRHVIKYLKNKGFEAYYKYSIQGFYYALRGKFYFFFSGISNINIWTSLGAIRMNLWHGVPIKTIGFDATNPIYKTSFITRFLYPGRYLRSHYVLSTSQKASELFASAFKVDFEQTLRLGYPRNEILSWSQDKVMDFVQKYEPTQTKELIDKLKQYKKVFVYMPTWRGNGQDFIKNANIDFEVLNNIMQEKSYCLLLKLHPITKLSIDVKSQENILLIDNKLDIYPILPFTDVLITDYSSIYFDYQLMDKEVILFPFDKEEYLDEDREMYFDYDKVTENKLLVSNFDELVNLIKKDNKYTSVQNDLLQKMMFETKGLESSKELVRFIMKLFKVSVIK